MNTTRKKPLLQSDLKSVLSYDPETGIFTRIKNPNKKVGCIDSQGYLFIGIGEKYYYGHRLAWLYMYGYTPENDIDHINRDRLDNRIDNLRHVSRTCNYINSKVSTRCKTGVTGVSWNKGISKWVARINRNRRLLEQRAYDTEEEAVVARYHLEQKYDFYKCKEDSSAYNYLAKKDSTALINNG